jgi:hypothetical protein
VGIRNSGVHDDAASEVDDVVIIAGVDEFRIPSPGAAVHQILRIIICVSTVMVMRRPRVEQSQVVHDFVQHFELVGGGPLMLAAN